MSAVTMDHTGVGVVCLWLSAVMCVVHGQSHYECKVGFYGPSCNFQCQHQCLNNTCNKDSGLCDACPGNYGGNTCSECKAGFYGAACHLRCQHQCLNNECIKDSGLCEECPGNYGGNTCSECKAGFYGASCNLKCQHQCLNNECIKDSGLCEECLGNYGGNTCSECKAGFYGASCHLQCQYKCLNNECTRDTGLCEACPENYQGNTCSECTAGFYGQSCNKKCPPLCLNNVCDKTTGRCAACPDGYRGDTCSECKAGFYGPSCDVSCQHQCLNNECIKDTGLCEACPGNFQGNTCSDCQAGWYGKQCNTACSVGCEDAVCDRQTGNCSECKASFYGPSCNLKCQHQCLNNECIKDSGLCEECPGNYQGNMCSECKAGFYGPSCNLQCQHQCLNNACNKVSGLCEECPGNYQGNTCSECKLNFYGASCSLQCPHQCLNNECNKDSGLCEECPGNYGGNTCSECKAGFYGPSCNLGCQHHCLNNECNEDSGLCEECPGNYRGNTCSECKAGFYGASCNIQCQHQCLNNECTRDTGLCEACLENYQGNTCSALTDTMTDNTPVIVGAVVSVIVLILSVVLIVIFIRRRQQNSAKSRAQESNTCNTAQNSVELGQPERAGSSPLWFAPVIATGDESHTKPKAQVKPVRRPATQHTSAPPKEDIYQNVDLQPQTSASGSPPTAPDPPAQHSGAASDVHTPRSEPLTEDEELDAPWSGQEEEIYSNDPSCTSVIRLDQLQETIVGSLREGKIAEEFPFMAGLKRFPLTNGKREENRYKNRFSSVLPYDRNRVVLEQVDGDDSSDYINASFVKGYKTGKAYIAAQGPRSNTQDDFWRMVWQEGVTDIVMLTNLKEGNRSKCHEYWPAKGESLSTGHMEVTGLEEEERAHFVIRIFSVGKTQSEEKRQVKQYHYVKWMDHHVPTTTPLVDFWRYIRARAPRTSTAPPLVVHCSAGVGRTGTYIALDILMDQSEGEEEISVYGTVSNLRNYRCYMVQNKDQYQFLHEAVLEAYMSGDSRLDTSSFDRVFPSAIRHDLPQPRVDAEFQRLCQMRTYLTDPSHTEASQEVNQHKNRNPDALPDDNHLVYITEHAKGRNQYINAVYMPTFLSERGSILTQLPLADTVIDLWRLVDSWNVSTIVSLGQVEGQEGMCCFWPIPKKPIRVGAYTISLKGRNSLGENLENYVMDITKKNESREVRVLHYEAWTGDTATSVPDLVTLLDILHTSHKESFKEPIIVQCFDGVAKSGALCALWDVISRMTCDGDVDVYLAARHVHTVRPEAITSVEQYRFLYEVVQQYRASRMVYANT
ncbi:uncharacterized protein LOC143296653 [Babylonia areolata]|uniref:uncharacterized protein LOC143296653 n=1 Tax=Babylonia areolata TaxID=304850 RepID=UPI003FD37136